MEERTTRGPVALGHCFSLAATGTLAFAGLAGNAQAQSPGLAVADPFNSFSVGAGFGVDFFRAPITASSEDDYAPPNSISTTARGSGPFTTVEIGKDFRIDRAVFGIYGDINFGNKSDGGHDETCSYACLSSVATVSLGDSRSLIARFGMLHNPARLVYGLAGVTWQDYSARVIASSEFQSQTIEAHRSGTLAGLTLGVGLERIVAPGWSVKGEYRFVQFDSIGSASATTLGCCLTTEATFGAVQDHILRFVVSAKLN